MPHCAIKSFCDSTPWGAGNSPAVHPPRLPHAARPLGGLSRTQRSVQVETLGLGSVRVRARVCDLAIELGGGWLGRRCRDAGVRVSDGPSSSGRVAGRRREDVGGGANLPGGCGRVSGSPLCAGAEPHRSAARLSGEKWVQGKEKMHNLAWIAPLGPPVRDSCVCVCACGLTGGTTHTNPSQLASFPGAGACALRAGTVPCARLALERVLSVRLTNTP